MVQTLDTRDQGEQGEDEEMKNEDLSPAVPERQMQIYGQRKQEDAGIATKAITTAQTVRMTNKTTAGQMTGQKKQKDSMTGKDADNGWDSHKNYRMILEKVRSKTKILTGMTKWEQADWLEHVSVEGQG